MKRKRIILTIILPVVFCLLAAGTALAMSSANYDLPWDVFSGGGIEDRSSSSYILGDTVGQPSAIGPSQSDNYRLGSGFWYGVKVTVAEGTCGDVNDDGLVNSTDALIILSYDAGMSVSFPVGTGACPASITQPPGCAP